MSDLLSLSLGFAALFIASLLLSYGFTRLVRRRQVPAPAPGAVLRLRAESGVYRARFVGETPEGWAFSAPLSRDAYVPLRIGEDLLIEAGFASGVMTFRTQLVARFNDTHVMVAQIPRTVFKRERREAPRVAASSAILVEGEGAQLVDVSSCGVRFKADRNYKRGDRIKLEIPEWEAPVFGWILETEAAGTRVRFEEELSGFLELFPQK